MARESHRNLLQLISAEFLVECQQVPSGHVVRSILVSFQHSLHRRRVQVEIVRSNGVHDHELEVIARIIDLHLEVDFDQRIWSESLFAMQAELLVRSCRRESINWQAILPGVGTHNLGADASISIHQNILRSALNHYPITFFTAFMIVFQAGLPLLTRSAFSLEFRGEPWCLA